MEPTTTEPGQGAVARQAIDSFAETTKRQAGVPAGRARLIAATDQLDTAIADLITAISPVLTTGTVNAVAEGPVDNPDWSEHAIWLHSQADGVEMAAARLIALARRVDL